MNYRPFYRVRDSETNLLIGTVYEKHGKRRPSREAQTLVKPLFCGKTYLGVRDKGIGPDRKKWRTTTVSYKPSVS